MHRNARLTPKGRLILVQRVLAGRPAAHVAEEMGVSRATAYKWVGRFKAEGVAGLEDRTSRPRRSPRRTDWRVEQRIVALRRLERLGPDRICERLGVARSTAHRVLGRHRLQRLCWLDRPTGRTIRRYERARAGELVHVDTKKLGRVPDGGGWRAVGRQAGRRNRASVGYEYVHTATNSIGTSSASAPVTFTTNAPDPVAPTVPTAPTLTFASATPTSVTLTIGAPSSNGGAAITRYDAICTSPGVPSVSATRTSPGAITISGLFSARDYACRAAATNRLGHGASSAAVKATTTGSATPGAVRGLVARIVSRKVAKISWAAPQLVGRGPIVSYSALVCKRNARTCTPATALAKRIVAAASTQVTLPFPGKLRSGAYLAIVYAANASGQGPAATFQMRLA